MTRIGPTFEAELDAAGLGGKLVGWNEAGQLFGLDALPAATQAAIAAVLAAHDPAKQPPPTLDFLGFMALFTQAEQDAIFAAADPQVRRFIAMATGSPSLSLGDARLQGGVAYLVTLGLLPASREADVLAGRAPP